MPKSNLLRTETARKNYASRARAGIKRHIELSKVSEDKIAAKQNVQVRTLMNRIEDPGSMRLRDLWDLAEIIGAPVGEGQDLLGLLHAHPGQVFHKGIGFFWMFGSS